MIALFGIAVVVVWLLVPLLFALWLEVRTGKQRSHEALMIYRSEIDRKVNLFESSLARHERQLRATERRRERREG